MRTSIASVLSDFSPFPKIAGFCFFNLSLELDLIPEKEQEKDSPLSPKSDHS